MTTVKKAVHISGHGIHSGLPANIVVRPSTKHGIFFRRVDMPNSKPIPATWDNVGETKMRNTTIGDPRGAHVQTIEHLMAALFMCGIDSAIIDIDGPETPILDGSAAEFYKQLSPNVASRNKMRRIIVRRPVTVYSREITRQLPVKLRIKLWLFNLVSRRKNDGFVSLAPADGDVLDITATLVYREPIIGAQTYNYKFTDTAAARQSFVKNMARARTFGKYSEWEYLKSHGMGRGASAENVIALNDAGDGTLNPTIWPDEFVRHKIIDIIGDMMTSGGFVVGKLTSYKGSHALNNLVLKKLFSDRNNYDIVESNKKTIGKRIKK